MNLHLRPWSSTRGKEDKFLASSLKQTNKNHQFQSFISCQYILTHDDQLWHPKWCSVILSSFKIIHSNILHWIVCDSGHYVFLWSYLRNSGNVSLEETERAYFSDGIPSSGAIPLGIQSVGFKSLSSSWCGTKYWTFLWCKGLSFFHFSNECITEENED